ncbi:hypothetical protein EDC01DRAFT_406045 [Geopyxis carbonaria]|nr:hypothetical protein EDC01DRAFT_406045 [Geopyxis carbonaria]
MSVVAKQNSSPFFVILPFAQPSPRKPAYIGNTREIICCPNLSIACPLACPCMYLFRIVSTKRRRRRELFEARARKMRNARTQRNIPRSATTLPRSCSHFSRPAARLPPTPLESPSAPLDAINDWRPEVAAPAPEPPPDYTTTSQLSCLRGAVALQQLLGDPELPSSSPTRPSQRFEPLFRISFSRKRRKRTVSEDILFFSILSSVIPPASSP